jgi:hypothetical protein
MMAGVQTQVHQSRVSLIKQPLDLSFGLDVSLGVRVKNQFKTVFSDPPGDAFGVINEPVPFGRGELGFAKTFSTEEVSVHRGDEHDVVSSQRVLQRCHHSHGAQ